MAMNEGLKAAFGGYTEGLLLNPDVAKRLEEKGLPVQKRVEELAKAKEEWSTKEAEYRELVARKRAASDEANRLLEGYYKLASAMVEQIVGTLGKDDPLSLEIRNWRDKMVLEALRGKKQEQPAQ